MKNGRPFGRDYFDELLERIREIRASERRAYQKIADVFEQCSYDYDKNSETTKAFYAFVQNKLHYAVTGKTAAELISERANLDSPAMGLTTWKCAPDGKGHISREAAAKRPARFTRSSAKSRTRRTFSNLTARRSNISRGECK